MNRAELLGRGAFHQGLGLFGVQLQREACPALLHQRQGPGVFQRPADLVRLLQLGGRQHAGGQGQQEAVEVAAQRIGRQQGFEPAQACAPARRGELARDQGLQRLDGVEQAQPVGRQHQQRHGGGLLVAERRDETGQHRQAPPLGLGQAADAGDRAGGAAVGQVLQRRQAVAALGPVGAPAHHRQVAGRIAGVVADAVDAAVVVAQLLARDGAVRGVELRQVVGRELDVLEAAATRPGMGAQGQPLLHLGRGRRAHVAAPAGHPAPLQR
mmetsp:Transcript_81444/g.226426  ORF Transcript_81444/g.226426 Transcript_81444/m.226426 type:complete len:269 (-) Transcript_81444:626-1432(-)